MKVEKPPTPQQQDLPYEAGGARFQLGGGSSFSVQQAREFGRYHNGGENGGSGGGPRGSLFRRRSTRLSLSRGAGVVPLPVKALWDRLGEKQREVVALAGVANERVVLGTLEQVQRGEFDIVQ